MAVNASHLEALILAKTCRVVVTGAAGDGSVAARQFDAVAMGAGFKCSRELLERLSGTEAGRVIDIATAALAVVRGQAGDHVRHNSYFIDFPANVPDTTEFWAQCLREALLDPVAAGQVEAGPGIGPDGRAGFFLNLLSLPSYGRYQHSYADMLAAHDELIPAVSDRVTVLHLGGPLDDEARDLYRRLAGSAVPLSAGDDTSRRCATAGTRSSRLRLRAPRARRPVPGRAASSGCATATRSWPTSACTPSGGSGWASGCTRTSTRATRGPPRCSRWPAARWQYRRSAARWRRRSHARTWTRPSGCCGPRRAGCGARPTGCSGPPRTWPPPTPAPPTRPPLTPPRWRWSWRPSAPPRPTCPAGCCCPSASTCRTGPSPVAGRLFANRQGRAWAAPDWRVTLDPGVIADACALIDAEIMTRLPAARVVLDEGMAGAALPLSSKPLPAGLGIFPRGSVTRVEGELLRFFIYWRQKRQRTDYDLSALFLDERYANPRHISWTRLSAEEAEHSGDVTQAPAPDGASEFINIRLTHLGRGFIVPLVYVYAGEGFEEVDESFFGFMTRDGEQAGQPFEARTVRMKSALVLGRRGSRCRWCSAAARTAPGGPPGCTCTCAATGPPPGAGPPTRWKAAG